MGNVLRDSLEQAEEVHDVLWIDFRPVGHQSIYRKTLSNIQTDALNNIAQLFLFTASFSRISGQTTNPQGSNVLDKWTKIKLFRNDLKG